MKLGFLFRHAPHGNACGREGLDAVLACSAYCEDIAVFFSGDGVFQLLSQQSPEGILTRDHAKTFKMFDLYDIETVLVCESSLRERGIDASQLLMPVTVVNASQWQAQWQSCQRIVTF